MTTEEEVKEQLKEIITFYVQDCVDIEIEAHDRIKRTLPKRYLNEAVEEIIRILKEYIEESMSQNTCEGDQ